ncbi:MAG: ABC transporter ATP-binding protein [Terriglobia bacterium]
MLDALELEVARGELLAVVGESGAGKTTLLHLLAALDRPTAGTIHFQGKPLTSLSPAELADYRNRAVGFVWQLANLLLDFTAAENVMLPLLARDARPARARQQAEEVLAEVGLAPRADHLAGELSGGEQQRVALARALVTRPRLLLADEPTGNLDENSATAVFALLETLHRSHGLTSLIATHNVALAGRCDRILRLEHGRL